MTNKTRARAAKAQPVKQAAATIRNSAGLREVLFDEIDMIRSGVSTPARANAVAKLTSGLIDTVRMDIEIQKHEKASSMPVKQAAKRIESPSGLSHSLT